MPYPVKHFLKSLLAGLLLAILSLASCSDHSGHTAQNMAAAETQQEQLPPAKDSLSTEPSNPFSEERIKALGDSIVLYFKSRAGYAIKEHETTIDTVHEKEYHKLSITVRTNTYKTNGLISYDIFTFTTKEQASEFFNDLKTQELLVPFGLNKRPNHILLDSNLVIWHHLEHPYGHRLRDLVPIFNAAFGYHPASSNLDSVSGFTYCRCKNEEAGMQEPSGRWQLHNQLEISKPAATHDHTNDCFRSISGEEAIYLSKDSIMIHGRSFHSSLLSSIRLPDSRLFWKYYFQSAELDVDPNDTMLPAFRQKLESLKQEKQKLTVYELKLTNHCFLSVIRLEKGKTYLITDRYFYELTKG